MNSYAPYLPSFDIDQRKAPQGVYKSPVGKILSIGAAAWSLVSAYDLPHIHEDAAALDKRVDAIVQCECRIVENIRSFQKVMTAFAVNKNDIARQDLLDQLMSFKSLVHSWDGFGAIPTSARCAAAAIRIMDGLSDQAIEEIEDFFPNTNGSVSFKWSNKLGEKLSLSIGANTFSYYCKKKGVEVEMYDELPVTRDTIGALNDDILSVMIANV